ncbi:MAG: hypothetical protein WDA47_07400 [Bacilli bacterium]
MSAEKVHETYKCELWHDPKEEVPNADNFILQKVVTQDGCVHISVAVCQECIDYLQGGEWLLLYCVNCGSSAWRIKELSHYSGEYENNIVWCPHCPHCGGIN